MSYRYQVKPFGGWMEPNDRRPCFGHKRQTIVLSKVHGKPVQEVSEERGGCWCPVTGHPTQTEVVD